MDNADVYEAKLYGAGCLKKVHLVASSDLGPDLVRFKSQLHTMVFNVERACVADPDIQDHPELMGLHAFSIVQSLDHYRTEALGKSSWIDDLGSSPKIFKPCLGRVIRSRARASAVAHACSPKMYVQLPLPGMTTHCQEI